SEGPIYPVKDPAGNPLSPNTIITSLMEVCLSSVSIQYTDLNNQQFYKPFASKGGTAYPDSSIVGFLRSDANPTQAGSASQQGGPYVSLAQFDGTPQSILDRTTNKGLVN